MIYRILPFLLILASIGIFFYYVNPTYTNDILGSQQRIASYNRALAAAKEYTSRENDLLAQKQQIPVQDINRLETFLPDDVDNVQLILDLSSIAARTGLTVTSFTINTNNTDTTGAPGATPTAPVANGAVTATPSNGLSSAISSSNLTDSLDIGITATGTYDAFRTFLTQTEESLRLLDVVSLSIVPAKDVDSYQIVFRLYWLH